MSSSSSGSVHLSTASSNYKQQSWWCLQALPLSISARVHLHEVGADMLIMPLTALLLLTSLLPFCLQQLLALVRLRC
jgi:hypothetical protein